jgi:uncharacterized protein (TIGR03086 family)
MDLIDQYGRALDQTGQIVAGVRPDQLDAPTSCSQWTVRSILGHLVRGNQNIAAAALGQPRQPNPIADVGDDPIGAYQESAEAARQAWQDAALLDQSYQSPLGTLPGRAVLTLRMADTVTHGWDLARATGQEPRYDDDIVQTVLAFAEARLSGDRPPGGPFAPPVAVPDDLPLIDRLAAYLGRQP